MPPKKGSSTPKRGTSPKPPPKAPSPKPAPKAPSPKPPAQGTPPTSKPPSSNNPSLKPPLANRPATSTNPGSKPPTTSKPPTPRAPSPKPPPKAPSPKPPATGQPRPPSRGPSPKPLSDDKKGKPPPTTKKPPPKAQPTSGFDVSSDEEDDDDDDEDAASSKSDATKTTSKPRFVAGGLAVPSDHVKVEMARNDDQQPTVGRNKNFYTSGASDCEILATINPDGLHSLTHVPGGAPSAGLFQRLLRAGALTPDTTVVVGAGGTADRNTFGRPGGPGDRTKSAMEEALGKGKTPKTFKYVAPTEEQAHGNLHFADFVLEKDGTHGYVDPKAKDGKKDKPKK